MFAWLCASTVHFLPSKDYRIADHQDGCLASDARAVFQKFMVRIRTRSVPARIASVRQKDHRSRTGLYIRRQFFFFYNTNFFLSGDGWVDLFWLYRSVFFKALGG